jgi:hypothetical protein
VQVARTRDGGEIHRSPSGELREVRTPSGAVIRHAPGGGREVEIVRPGGRVVVANGSGRYGYIQRPLEFHGQPFIQRTYVVNGVAYPRVYRSWSYGGRVYPVYAPMHYYRPAFYRWAYTPWGRPVQYGWGWSGRPWYGYYGGYFTPYPVYMGPSFWLADFVIAATLESAYLAQNYPAGPPPVSYDPGMGMTPEVKQAIADEVRRQMDQEQADQAAYQGTGQVSAPPPLFSDRGPRVFLVATPVTGYAGGQECPLGEGDVLGLVQTPAPGSEWAQVRVMASRRYHCPRGTILSVRTLDLQEMQNHLQASLDQGLDKLNADQGRNGLPALPPGTGGMTDAAFASQLQAEDKALDELSLAVKDADQSEQATMNQGASPGGSAPAYAPAGGPPSGATLALGMSIAQVVAAMGQPRNTVDLGARQIYIYPNLKVTFQNGRVSDVQ